MKRFVPGPDRSPTTSLGRSVAAWFLFVVLTVWALAMIVPDLGRPFHPLSSFGLSTNNDGLVIDVQGPFPDEASSPAWQAGIREGDRLELGQMTCLPVRTLRCATAQALLGSLLFVSDQRQAEIALAASADHAARTVSIMAKQRPFSGTVIAILLINQAAAVLVVLAAAWLVLTRPSRMTWAFFLYVIWFNPGQCYVFYATLQLSPIALLIQDLAAAMAQGVALAALLVFVLQVPADRSDERWAPLLRMAPPLAAGLGLLLLASYANLFGIPTETLTRAGVATGFVVAVMAVAILLARRSELPPAEYQRLRWVLWGCLIGLPALILADFGQETTLLTSWIGGLPPTDVTWDALRLINGIFCLFVFEAVRKPRVINVAIPLRRVTVLGLMLSFPALLLHQQAEHFREELSETMALPSWVWLALAVGVLFAISRLHETTVHLADRHFNRHLIRAGHQISAKILDAQDNATVDRALSSGLCEALHLTSAVLFRDDGHGLARSDSGTHGHPPNPPTLHADDALIERSDNGKPFDVSAAAADTYGFDNGSGRPVLGMPITRRFQRFGFAFYGEHIAGTAFSYEEKALIGDLANKAADVYAKIERDALRARIESLEHRLDPAPLGQTAGI